MSKQIQIRRSAARWRALFAAHDVSGLSAAAFCREHALCPKYFSLRRRQLGWQSVAMPTLESIPEPRTSLTLREQHRDIAPKVLRADRVRADRSRQFVRVEIPPRDADLALTVSVTGVTMTLSPTVSGPRILALIDALRST